jgi:hypothetical protein
LAALSAQISVTAPIQPAIERTRHLLFQPFNLARWFTIGFCAWLAGLGQSGAGGYNLRYPFSPGAQHPPSSGRIGAPEWWEELRGNVVRNLDWLLPVAVALVCLLVAIWLLLIWLSSRGDFMFLHCVALDRAEVAVPWRHYVRAARSLFLFRASVGLIATVPILLLFAVIGVSLFRIFGRGDTGAWIFLVAAGLALVVVALGFSVVAKLTRDFVVPIMWLHGGTCRQGWSELLGLFAGRLGDLVVYLLFQIVLALAIGALVFAALIVTCCLAACLLILPYLGTVALLPVLAFKRAYSLYYLRQFGERYDPFQAAAPPPAPAAP